MSSLDCIVRYLADATEVTTIMKEHFDADNLLRQQRLGAIPERGEVGGQPPLMFRFHGGGCYFVLGEKKIDVDFGPNGSADGFDAARLSRYSREMLERHQETFDWWTVELEGLRRQGLIEKPDLAPNLGLYFATESFWDRVTV